MHQSCLLWVSVKTEWCREEWVKQTSEERFNQLSAKQSSWQGLWPPYLSTIQAAVFTKYENIIAKCLDAEYVLKVHSMTQWCSEESSSSSSWDACTSSRALTIDCSSNNINTAKENAPTLDQAEIDGSKQRNMNNGITIFNIHSQEFIASQTWQKLKQVFTNSNWWEISISEIWWSGELIFLPPHILHF